MELMETRNVLVYLTNTNQIFIKNLVKHQYNKDYRLMDNVKGQVLSFVISKDQQRLFASALKFSNKKANTNPEDPAFQYRTFVYNLETFQRITEMRSIWTDGTTQSLSCNARGDTLVGVYSDPKQEYNSLVVYFLKKEDGECVDTVSYERHQKLKLRKHLQDQKICSVDFLENNKLLLVGTDGGRFYVFDIKNGIKGRWILEKKIEWSLKLNDRQSDQNDQQVAICNLFSL